MTAEERSTPEGARTPGREPKRLAAAIPTLPSIDLADWRASHPGRLLDLQGGSVFGGELDATALHPVRARRAQFVGVTFCGGPLVPWHGHVGTSAATEFSACVFSRCNFTDARLGSPVFNECHFLDCSFSQCRGKRVEFHGCKLRQCDFTEARFTATDFRESALEECNFRDARLGPLEFGGTHFIRTDVSVLPGLATARHAGRSEISVDTLANLRRDLPHEFVRGSGLDPLVAALFHGTAEQRAQAFYDWIARDCPTRLQSCFISYATPDLAFVVRLQTALNAAGVDYWYAPEHGRWGEELRHQVRREIALRDRMIVVCSASSLERDWVRFEIEEALEAEKKHPLAPGKRRLFPVMIDNALLEWRDPLKGRLCSILAGDFRGATEPGSAFDAAVARLLQGLRTDASARP